VICPRCFDEVDVIEGVTTCDCCYRVGHPVPRCMRCGEFMECDCPDGGLRLQPRDPVDDELTLTLEEPIL
jgi:hypothetical protein